MRMVPTPRRLDLTQQPEKCTPGPPPSAFGCVPVAVDAGGAREDVAPRLEELELHDERDARRHLLARRRDQRERLAQRQALRAHQVRADDRRAAGNPAVAVHKHTVMYARVNEAQSSAKHWSQICLAGVGQGESQVVTRLAFIRASTTSPGVRQKTRHEKGSKTI